jgi:hypothetical protein
MVKPTQALPAVYLLHHLEILRFVRNIFHGLSHEPARGYETPEVYVRKIDDSHVTHDIDPLVAACMVTRMVISRSEGRFAV